MSCYICGRQIDDVKLDIRDMKTAPCGTCEQVIQECLDGYHDPDSGEYGRIEPDLEDFDEELYGTHNPRFRRFVQEDF